MKKSTSLAILGGDMRQAFLAQLLCEDGHTVAACALERSPLDAGVRRLGAPEDCVQQAQAVILPMPAERDAGALNAPLSNTSYHIQTILDAVPPGKLVLAGAASDVLRERAARNRLKLIDYLAREELAIRNAVPTALAVWLAGQKKQAPLFKRRLFWFQRSRRLSGTSGW